MKREALDHPKLHRLADELVLRAGVDPRDAFTLATGALERLWGWTAKHCPDGRIGRYPHGAIARGCAWARDPEALIASFVEARWIDGVGEQLVVHDWSHHADRHVHRALVRRLEHFDDGTKPKISHADEAERARWLEHFVESVNPPGSPPGPSLSRSQSQSPKNRTVDLRRSRDKEPLQRVNGHGGSLSRPGTVTADEAITARVGELRERLRDRSSDERNLRVIVAKLPWDAVDLAAHEAWAAFRDGRTKTPTPYFVGICKRRARELAIELGLRGKRRSA